MLDGVLVMRSCITKKADATAANEILRVSMSRSRSLLTVTKVEREMMVNIFRDASLSLDFCVSSCHSNGIMENNGTGFLHMAKNPSGRNR